MAYNITKNQKKQDISAYFIFGALFFFIIMLGFNLFKLGKQLVTSRQILQRQLLEKKSLQADADRTKYLIKKKQTAGYIEDRAHDFALSRKNEFFVLSQNINSAPKGETKKVIFKPNINRWWDLFFR